MGLAPEKPFDERAIARAKAATAASPPYRCIHPTVTVSAFLQLRGNYEAQRRIDNECSLLEQGKRRWDAENTRWLFPHGDQWHPEGWQPLVHRPRLRPRYQPHGPHQLCFVFYQWVSRRRAKAAHGF